MRKGTILILAVMTAVYLAAFFGCEKETADPPAAPVDFHIVKFYSDSGLDVLAEEKFRLGEKVVYDGASPQKASDGTYDYVFVGWSKNVGGAVEEDIAMTPYLSLYAVFEKRAAVRVKIAKPVADERAFTFNGSEQHYGIEMTDDYKVYNAYATAAGEYTVVAALRDKVNKCWADGTDDDLKFSFVIERAENQWTSDPAVSDYSDDAVGTVSGAAAFGEVNVTFVSSDGAVVSQMPTQKGKYTAVFSVEGTNDYTALECRVGFRVIGQFCTVTFSDGVKVLQTDDLRYGTVPVYNGEKLGSLISVFIGWSDGDDLYDADLPAAVDDVTYYARFKSEFTDEFGSETDPYVLTLANEMEFLKDKVAEGDTFENKYFALGADLDFGGGIGSQDSRFLGSFDGRGYTVTVSGENGLFGCNGGVVKNVNVCADIDGDVVGAVANVNYGEITDCGVRGTVCGSTVGGVVGENRGRVAYCASLAFVRAGGAYETTSLVGNGGLIVGSFGDGHEEVFAHSVWDGGADTAFAGGDGSENAPYLISTGAQLAFLKDSLASKAYYKGKYFKLTDDIDLNGVEWSGIGNGSSGGGFAGVFDGNGHFIYNVNVKYQKNTGFFRSVNAVGVIKDLNIFGKVEGKGSQYVALLAGINSGKISGCSVFGSVDSDSAYTALCAAWTCGDVTDCATCGKVSGSGVVGGVVGYDSASGGKIGNIENCANYATVYSEAESAFASTVGIGGVVALLGSGAEITDCVNYGCVSALRSETGTGGVVGQGYSSRVVGCENHGNVAAARYVGGIVGYGREGGSATDCKNYGEIYAADSAGGVAGYNRYDLSGCENFGKVEGDFWIGGVSGMQGGGNNGTTVENCVNRGAVKGGGGQSGGVGGIVGSNYNKVVVYGCDNYGAVSGNEGYYGGIVGENRSGASVAHCKNFDKSPLFGSDASTEELVYGNEYLYGGE